MGGERCKLKNRIVDSLRSVIDPGTNENIIDMALVKEIEVDEGGKVSLTFRPSSPVCPMAFKLAGEIQGAARKVEGVKAVNISVLDYIRAEELERLINKH